ncbi:MAG: hypothetical protein ACI4ED_08195 [Suilimivivens sp.]
MAMMFSACNAKKLVEETVKNQMEKTDETSGNEAEKGEEENGEVTEADNNEETDEADTAQKSKDGVPVLGQEDIEDYEGFTYLYCENLRTQSEENKETGKMESKSLPVFIPQSDYVYVSMDYASVEKLGVTFRVELEPSIRYDQEDYLTYENLEYYVEGEFDPFYTSQYKDVVLGEVEDIDRNTARMTAEVCYYNEYYDSYSPVFNTYFLKTLENDCTVLVEISINGDDVTGKTPELLEELEAFYEFEIDWDKERADKKVEDFLASGGDNTFSTGYLLFELPEGWSKDTEVSEYDTPVYAPDGDADFAGCFIALYEEYVGYNAFKGVENSTDELVEIVQQYLDEEGVKAEVSSYGETCLGTAILSVMTVDDEEMGTAVFHIYWIFNDSYMYKVTAVAVDGATDNPFVVAEGILKDGQVPD